MLQYRASNPMVEVRFFDSLCVYVLCVMNSPKLLRWWVTAGYDSKEHGKDRRLPLHFWNSAGVAENNIAVNCVKLNPNCTATFYVVQQNINKRSESETYPSLRRWQEMHIVICGILWALQTGIKPRHFPLMLRLYTLHDKSSYIRLI